MNILIIDDDADDAAILCEALGEVIPGPYCTCVQSLKLAGELIESSISAWDYVFLDGHLGALTGMQCVKELQILISAPIVIHSGGLSPNEIADLKVVGAAAFVPKAHDYRELVSSLRQFLLKTPTGNVSFL